MLLAAALLALLSAAAYTEPTFRKHPPEELLNDADAGALDAPTARVDAGGRAPQPVLPTTPDGGPAKPGMSTAAVLGGFRTASQPRSAGNLTLHEDGFDTGDMLCVGTLCATGRFEP